MASIDCQPCPFIGGGVKSEPPEVLRRPQGHTVGPMRLNATQGWSEEMASSVFSARTSANCVSVRKEKARIETPPRARLAPSRSSKSFTTIRKDAGLYCGSRLRSGEVFAYVGSIQNLKDLKGPSVQGLFELKDTHRP